MTQAEFDAIKVGDEVTNQDGELIKVTRLLEGDVKDNGYYGCVGGKRWIKSKQKWSGNSYIQRILPR